MKLKTDSRTHRGQPRATDTVDATLAATIEILDEVGEHGLRMADVVRRSGVSTGSVYHFFGDRDGLIEAARAKQFRDSTPSYVDSATELVTRSNSASEFLGHLKHLIRDAHSQEENRRRLQRIVYLASSVSRPDLQEELRSQLSELLSEDQAVAQLLVNRGWVKEGVSARALTSLMMAIALGAIVLSFDNDPVDDDQWAHVVQLATEGLFRTT